jgi:hypothetical protein
MTAKTKSRRAARAAKPPKPPMATDAQLEAWLSGNDLDLFSKQVRKAKGRERFCREINCRVTALRFAAAVESHCHWWCRRRVCPEKHETELTGAQWDLQLAAVRKLKAELTGKPILHALMIVRTETSTCERILRNLPGSVKVWVE